MRKENIPKGSAKATKDESSNDDALLSYSFDNVLNITLPGAVFLLLSVLFMFLGIASCLFIEDPQHGGKAVAISIICIAGAFATVLLSLCDWSKDK